MNVLVVGAGIGGLISALALSRDGHSVTLIEQQPVFKALGAAVLLPRSVMQILANLDVDLTGRGVEITGLRTMDEAGQALFSPTTPACSISRSSLHEAILATLGDRVEVIFGAAIKRIRILSSGALATWLESTQEFDLIVGADSMNSSVRSRIMGPSPLIYTGFTAWRGIAPTSCGAEAIEMWGDSTRVLMSPLPGERTSYTIITKTPSRAPAPKWPSGFARLLDKFGDPWPSIWTTLTAPPPFHRDLYMLAKPAWGVPHVLLVGDAAHVHAPTLWQGASLAVEDAAALALAARDTSGGADTLKKYESMRDTRVRTLQALARRVAQVQRSSGLVRSIQNRAIRLIPDRVVGKHNEVLEGPGWKLAEGLVE